MSLTMNIFTNVLEAWMNISLRLGQMNKIRQMLAILNSVCNRYISGATKSFRQEPTPTCFIFFQFQICWANLFSEWQHKQGKEGRKSIGKKQTNKQTKSKTWDELYTSLTINLDRFDAPWTVYSMNWSQRADKGLFC